MLEADACLRAGDFNAAVGVAAASTGDRRPAGSAQLRTGFGRRLQQERGMDLSAGAFVSSEGVGVAGTPDTTPDAREIGGAIVRAARRGDHRAFAAIVEHYDDRLRALAFHVLRDPQVLDDALQEAYVRAYSGLRTFRGSASLGTWLHRLTYTTCLNILRERSRRPSSAGVEVPDSCAGSVDPADLVAGADGLAALLGRLPVEQRAVIVLVDADGHTYAEAAGILGIPPGTVASRLVSAREKLRGVLSAATNDLAPSTPEEVPR